MSQTTEKNKAKQRKIFWVIGAVVIVLLILFFINQRGSSAPVAITPVGHTASVFIDRSRTTPLSATTSDSMYHISPGQHEVLIAADGYWPWSETITATSGTTTKITPFLIEETSSRVLKTPDTVSADLTAASREPVPTSSNPIVSADGNVRVFVDSETNLIAQWTGSPDTAPDYFNCHEGTCGVSVYNRAPIRQVAFYPDRNDVLFFATDTGVYAIEVDPSGETQNFQPVVETSSEPHFAFSDGQIFVLSNGRITVSEI